MYTLKECRKDLKICDAELAKCAKILDSSPEGSLLLNKKKQLTFWFLYDTDTRKTSYIPRFQKDLAEKLAAKRIASFRMKYYTSIKNSLQAFAKCFPESLGSEEEFANRNRELYSLAAPYISTPALLSDWMNAEYERNPNHPETLKFKTLKGDYVRSKSECMIADALFLKGIPYRYECKLLLKQFNSNTPYEDIAPSTIALYPDFTIMHPTTGQIIIWEHFGLITDPTYASKTINKLQLYTNNGYTVPSSFITTYESLFSPLDSSTINDIIEKMFL